MPYQPHTGNNFIQNQPLCKTLTNQDGHHQHMLSHATTATTFSTYAPAMDVRPLHSTMVLHPNCIIPQAHLPGLRQHASRGPHDSISLAQSTDSVYGAILFWAVRCTPHGSHRLRTSCRSPVSITCAALTRSRASSVGDALKSVTMV